MSSVKLKIYKDADCTIYINGRPAKEGEVLISDDGRFLILRLIEDEEENNL